MNTQTPPAPLAPGANDLTDLVNAERFTQMGAGKVMFHIDSGQWLVWDGQRWRADHDGQIMELAGEVARSYHRDAGVAGSLHRQEELSKWAVASQCHAKLKAMIDIASKLPALRVSSSELDQDHMLLNVANATIDLRTEDLRPHNPADRITKLAPVAYDPLATCPTYDRFTARIFAGQQDMIDYIHRLFGYCLTGSVSEQHLFILNGSGANGKSVVLDTFKTIMGDYAGNVAPGLLTMSNFNEHPTQVADLCGLRLGVVSELDENVPLNVAAMKRMTGDAKLKARFMRQDYFEFNRTTKLVMATNNLPLIREQNNGVRRRMQVVPFYVIIPEHEQDRGLLQALRKELPGILSKLIKGVMEYQRIGLKPPPQVVSATNMYRDRFDDVGRFLADECHVVPGDRSLWTSSTTLHNAYNSWAMCNEANPLTPAALGNALEKIGLQKLAKRISGKSTAGRLGVRLLEAGEPRSPNV